MKLILGLGNPGTEYEGTRHNAGRMAVETLADDIGATWKKDRKRSADVAKASFDGTEAILARTAVYMNESGTALQALSSFYKVKPDDILVVQDEMDMPPGRMAFLRKGGAAGHNGINDIQRATGRDDICRLRIGIGRPDSRKPAEDWVLERPSAEDTDIIRAQILRSTDAIKDWISLGMEKAMTTWNTKGKK
jgi:PTH1 family peptidyl-tRNA hydrolase